MSSNISIETNWLPPFQGPEEVRRTSAEIRISFGTDLATRCQDDWPQSVQERARVAAYPLALWFVSSWWRLRWEPEPVRVRLQQNRSLAETHWRISHHLPAAGHGFIWPPLTFVSDGDTIAVLCKQSNPSTDEPVRYLSEFAATVSAQEFEHAVHAFISLVCNRLDPLKTELLSLWQEVLNERADPEQSSARKIEARLGYDPDEAPPSLMEDFFKLAVISGPDAADEIAPICAGVDPARSLELILELASQPGVQGRVKIPVMVEESGASLPPWQGAKTLAELARKSLGMNGKPFDDQSLCDLLEIPKEVLNFRPSRPCNGADVGLAMRIKGEHNLKFLFHRRSRLGRRFEAARFVCNSISRLGSEGWFPVTDARAARQKMQRSFATEFFCPIDALREFLNDEFNQEAFGRGIGLFRDFGAGDRKSLGKQSPNPSIII